MDTKIEILDVTRGWLASRSKIGVHRRKTRDKVYESPRITLPGEYKDLIGRRFKAYRGHARITEKGFYHEYGPEDKEVLILVLEPAPESEE